MEFENEKPSITQIIELSKMRYNHHYHRDIEWAAPRELAELQKNKASHTKRYAEIESDYALSLCHLKKTKEALAILERLIQSYPNEYNMVANLGTTYELTGQNEKALQYIKKGLELNKESHAGSEWIHIKILEAKIAMQTNSNWLKENEILGKEARETAQGNDKAKIKQLIQDLGFQLFERTQFIQPKDAMVGDLIMFLGDLYKQIGEYKHAVSSYTLAKTYTVSKPEVLEASLEKAEEKTGKVKPKETKVIETSEPQNIPQDEPKRSPLFTVLVLAGLAVLVGGVWLMYFRSK
jgi:tetratricopeptide (TPR) repeat protein